MRRAQALGLVLSLPAALAAGCGDDGATSGQPGSPAQAPGPYRYRGGHCSCGRCRMRGLRGPVILITIGVLFLLPQFFYRIEFRDLWPVILIVIGVLMLLESSASTEGHRG